MLSGDKKNYNGPFKTICQAEYCQSSMKQTFNLLHKFRYILLVSESNTMRFSMCFNSLIFFSPCVALLLLSQLNFVHPIHRIFASLLANENTWFYLNYIFTYLFDENYYLNAKMTKPQTVDMYPNTL